MAKLFVVIQARLSSTRLPQKVLLPLCNTTMLEVMLLRLKNFHENIIIATTNSGDEAPIIEIANIHELKYFQGETINVLDRFHAALTHHGANEDDIVVRLTSDCPLIDERIVKETIDYFENNDFEYVNNTLIKTFPRGLDCEVFRFKTLTKAYQNATTDFEKEHVTTYIYNTHKDEFKVGCYSDKEDNSKYRLTVDEYDDYKAVEEIFSLFDNRLDFSYNELIEKLKHNKHITQINAHVEQKKS